MTRPNGHDGDVAGDGHLATETYMTLEEAARRFFPGGVVTKRSLRTEVRKGRLTVVRIAGKDLVTERSIRSMLEACACPAHPKVRASSCGSAKDARLSGSSGMDRKSIALAAAEKTLQELKERLKTTS